MQTQNSLVKYYLCSISAALIWAFMVIPVRELHAYNPFAMLLSRIMLATCLLYVYMFTLNRKAFKEDLRIFRTNEIGTKKKVLLLILFSGLCLALNWFAYIYLIVKIDIKSASLVYVISPLLLAVGSFIIYKDALDKYKIISLILAFIVIVILSYDHLHTILYVLFCAASYTTFMLLQKQLPALHRLNLFAYEVLPIFIFSLPFFILQLQHNDIGLDWFFWSRLLFIAVCFTILPMFLNLYSFAKIPGSSVAMIIYLNPISSVLLGVLFFDEHLFYQEALLYAILLLSIIIFNINNIKSLLYPKS